MENNNAHIKGRFAPSPTGRMHAGNIFSALVAWLVAKSQGGTMVLRVEDLDRERSKPQFIDAVQRDFETLGLTWDEGPYFQHNRDEAYQAAFDSLVERGIVIALRQAPVTLAHHQRNMGILSMRQPEQILQIALLRARTQQIHAAHHAVYALLAIVNHHGELIRKCLVTSTNEEIAAIVREVLFEMTLD